MAIIKQKASFVDANTHDNAPRKYSQAEQLKAITSFRKLLEEDGHSFEGHGDTAKCCCPFHEDRTPSFSIYAQDTRAKCFGCDWGGDIFAYEMKAHGVNFPEAIRRIEGKAERIKRNRPPEPRFKFTPKKQIVSEVHHSEQKRYAERLATDVWIQERISERRITDGHKWSPETLKKLGVDGSLGWAGDALAFIYRTGTKYRRWPYRDFKWDENEGISLWREDRIANASRIYITEGETDAITLVDCGLENDPSVAVIAIQGSTSFLPAWAEYFDGKIVTLCFDSDDAGREAEKLVGDLLVARGIEVFTSSVKGVAK